MKPILFSLLLLATFVVNAQEDKSKRPSPPALVKETLNNGNKKTEIPGRTEYFKF